MHRLRATLLFLILAAACITAAGCGEKSGNGGADPASIAPASAPAYFEFAVRPSGTQKQAVDDLVRRITSGRKSAADLRDSLIKSMERSRGKGDKLDFAKDIDPWLGNKAGITVLSPSGSGVSAVLIVAAKDLDKLRSELDGQAKKRHLGKRSYRGISYFYGGGSKGGKGGAFGVVDDFLVAGNEAALKATIDAHKGRSLAEADRFKNALKSVPKDRLGFGYVDGSAFLASLSGAGVTAEQRRAFQKLGGGGKGPATFDVQARKSGLVLETQASSGTAAPVTSQLLGELPADSFFGIATPGVGERLRRALSAFASIGGAAGASPNALLRALKAQTGFDLERDLLSWVGDVALFARGSSSADAGAGVVIESRDSKASERALRKLVALVKRFGARSGLKLSGNGPDFSVRVPGLPVPVTASQQGNRVAIAAGRDAAAQALDPGQRLSSSAAFRRAGTRLGAGYEQVAFLRLQPILALAETLGARQDRGYMSTKPYLERLEGFIVGVKRERNRTFTRLLLGVR